MANSQDDSSGGEAASDGEFIFERAAMTRLESDRGSWRSSASDAMASGSCRTFAKSSLGPLVMLEVAKQPKTSSPWMLDQDWVQPPPGPADGGEGSAQPRYTLTAGRPYRIALAQRPSGEGSVRKWAGVRLYVRLTFADDGATVKPDALLAFPPGSRSALTSWEVSLRMNRHGFTDEVFGIAAPSETHGGRLYRVHVFVASSRAEAGAFGVRVSPAAPERPGRRRRPALSKRQRLLDAGSSAVPAVLSPQSSSGLSSPAGGHFSPDSPFAALGLPPSTPDQDWNPVASPPPAAPPPPPAPPADRAVDELADAFGDLCRFDSEPAAAHGATGEPPRPPPAASGELDASSVDDEILSFTGASRLLADESSESSCPTPTAFAACGRPPYRQADDTKGQLALVEAAAAAAAAVANACGVRHPVPASAPPPRAVVLACADLASALSSPGLFGTPLFATRDGRYRLRRMVEDLRLSGSSDLVDTVHNCWRDALLSGPVATHAAPEEAEALAGHVWDALEAIIGPPHGMRAVDLVPVDREFVFALLDRADQVLKEHIEAYPVLHVKALMRRAWLLFMYGDVDAALDLYFTGWSVVIRRGLSPSRLEAQLLCELIEVLLRVPSKWDLADNLCSKVYWLTTGDPEDFYLEAYATRTLGMVAMSFGRWRTTKQHLMRSVAILESMSEGYRTYAERVHKNIGHFCFHTTDFPGTARAVWRAVSGVLSLGGFSFQELDDWAYSLLSVKAMADSKCLPGRMARPYTMSDFARTMHWVVILFDRLGPQGHPFYPALHYHNTYTLGLASACCGDWAKALACFEKARAFYARYPAYFPPRLARCRNVADGIALCRARLAAGPAAAADDGGAIAAGRLFPFAASDASTAPSPFPPVPPVPPLSAPPAPARSSRRPPPSWSFSADPTR